MNKVDLGQFIVQLRKEKGLTQVELANQLHISNKTISKWETGRGLPDVSMLEPLAKALDISVVELINQERVEDTTTFTKESVSLEMIKSMEYSKKHSEAEKYDGLLGASFSFAIFFMITGSLVFLLPYYVYVGPFLGLFFLIKGIWNMQNGKPYALSISLGILFLVVPFLLEKIMTANSYMFY